MSTIGVDAHTYALMHSRTYAQALDRCAGDKEEARALAAYWMREWYVITDDEAPQQSWSRNGKLGKRWRWTNNHI